MLNHRRTQAHGSMYNCIRTTRLRELAMPDLLAVCQCQTFLEVLGWDMLSAATDLADVRGSATAGRASPCPPRPGNMSQRQ